MNEKHTPQCIGFIMDGNRRWAKKNNLPLFEGHKKGYETLKGIISSAHAKHIPHIVCYAFSTENWKRAQEEVTYLMHLLTFALNKLPTILEKENKKINICIIGERAHLSEELKDAIIRAESKNYTVPELTVWVALSYGGRAEIVDATNRAITEGGVVTEETFKTLLWTNGMPDPDIIIRTSGERRISNFLLWQSAYSEFFFTDTLWPDFGEREFQSILEEYATRERRKGK